MPRTIQTLVFTLPPATPAAQHAFRELLDMALHLVDDTGELAPPADSPLACARCGLALLATDTLVPELTEHPEATLLCPFCTAALLGLMALDGN